MYMYIYIYIYIYWFLTRAPAWLLYRCYCYQLLSFIITVIAIIILTTTITSVIIAAITAANYFSSNVCHVDLHPGVTGRVPPHL